MLELAHTIGRGRISDVDWSADGAQLAVAGSCGVWLYDTANWESAPELRIESRDALTLVALSPDGAQIATATEFGNIRVWTAAGTLAHIFEEPRGEIHALAWSPDGSLLACGGQDGMIYVWQMATGRRWLALRLPPPEPDISPLGAPVHGVAFSPDGAQIAAGSRDGLVRVWDAATGASVRILKEKGRWITDIAYSPDGATIAASRVDGSAWVWDAVSGEDLFIMEGHAGTVDRVRYNPRVGANGPIIASGGGDGEVVLWSAQTGDYLGALSGHLNGVIALAFKPDGAPGGAGVQLAVAAWDGALRVWDVSGAPGSGTLRHTLQGHADTVLSLGWSPDAAALVSVHEDEVVRDWDAVSGTVNETIVDDENGARCAAISPDGALLATGTANGLVLLERRDDGDLVHELEGHTEAVRAVAFCVDSVHDAATVLLASAGDDNMARIWNVHSGQQVRALTEFSGAVTGIAWTPDGALLAASCADGILRVWESHHWERALRASPDAGALHGVAFSADGSVLAVACNDRAIRLWGMEAGELIGTLRGHRAAVLSVQFSPDGRTLASGGAEGDICLWDMLTDTCTQTIPAHPQAVTRLAWRTDGSQLVSGGREGTMRVWRVALK